MTYLFVAGEELTAIVSSSVDTADRQSGVEILSTKVPAVIKRQITVQFFEQSGVRNKQDFVDLQISGGIVTGDAPWVALWRTLFFALEQGNLDAELILESPTHLVGQVTDGRRIILTTSIGRIANSDDRFGGWNLIGTPADEDQFPTRALSYSKLTVLGDYPSDRNTLVTQVMDRQGCGPYDALLALERLGVPIFCRETQHLVGVPYFDFSDGAEDVTPASTGD